MLTANFMHFHSSPWATERQAPPPATRPARGGGIGLKVRPIASRTLDRQSGARIARPLFPAAISQGAGLGTVSPTSAERPAEACNLTSECAVFRPELGWSTSQMGT